MSVSQPQPNPQYLSAIQALQRNDATGAKQILVSLINQGNADVSILLAYAVACNKLGQSAECFESLDSALELDPGNLTVLLMKGDLLMGQGKKRLANHCYGIAEGIADNTPDLPADLRQAVNRVAAIRKNINHEIEQHLLSNIHFSDASPEQSARFRQSLALLNGSKTIYPQKPRAYYFPELPLKQFYQTSQFEWVSQVEAATDGICQELSQLIQDEAQFLPYIRSEEQGPAGHVNPLLDKSDWSAFFLIKDGEVVEENAKRCPLTMQALESVPMPDIKGRAPMVLFSLLKPGTRIEPHHGFLNTRLICHLPLIVPDKCGLRVGNEVHHWQRGKVVAFDDSIEHEAWNNSEQNRVVLIFDIWRPELSRQEREWVSQLLEAIDTFD